MNPALFIVIADASYPAILAVDGPGGTNLIQGSVSMGGNTYYITGHLSLPGGALYVAKILSDGTFIVSLVKQAGLTPVHTFFGWGVPA